MTLPVSVGQQGAASILRWYEGNGMFTDEELRAWVLDGGTRFVPPQNTYDETYHEDFPDIIVEVSAERQQLTDEDVRRALSMLGAAVEIDLAGAELLTDAIISEIGSRFSSLETLNLAYVELAARARALSLSPHARLTSPARAV